jgi:hypothetical protein
MAGCFTSADRVGVVALRVAKAAIVGKGVVIFACKLCGTASQRIQVRQF